MTDISRRTVLKAAVWTAPAVMLAAAAPAYAISPNGTVAYGPATGSYPLDIFPGLGVELTLEASVPTGSESSAVVDAMTVAATLTIPAALRAYLMGILVPATQVGVHVDLPLAFTGATTGVVSTPLAFQAQPWSAGADLVLTTPLAPASTLAIPAGAAGPVAITVAPLTGVVTGYDDEGTEVSTHTRQLSHRPGVDYTLASFAVA